VLNIVTVKLIIESLLLFVKLVVLRWHDLSRTVRLRCRYGISHGTGHYSSTVAVFLLPRWSQRWSSRPMNEGVAW